MDGFRVRARHRDSEQKNHENIDIARRHMDTEQFDLALRHISLIRGSSIMRRSAVKEYLRRLSVYFEKIKLNKSLPFGWLSEESADFADTVRVAVARLGDDFYSVLVDECVSPKDGINRPLLHLFLEFTQNGFLWSDVIRLLLVVAGHPTSSISIPRYEALYEILSNIRQFVAEMPDGVIPNPLVFTTAEARKAAKNLDDPEDFLFKGQTEISLADITKRIAVAKASAAVTRAGISVNKGTEAGSLFVMALERKLFRESLLLVRHCQAGDSATVFREFTSWIIRITHLSMSTLWDEFAAQVQPFFPQLCVSPAETIWQKDQEPADLFIQRILTLAQGSLIDTFLENGTIDDLRVIVTCYTASQISFFPRLEALLVSPQYFCEFLWCLVNTEGTYQYIYRYMLDWISSVEGGPCVATYPSFCLTGDTSVELAYATDSLQKAIVKYFQSLTEASSQEMGAALLEKLSALNSKRAPQGSSRHLQVLHRQKANFPVEFDESSSEEEDDASINGRWS